MSEVIVASDRLPARLIKPHTHEKFYLHRRYCSIFNSGMQKQWPRNRGYLELFAGSGLAYDAITGAEHEASPILAATLNSPGFSRLAFVEYDQELAHALEARLRSRGIADGRARVFAGDANDRYVLARALAFLPDPGLIFVFAGVDYAGRARRRSGRSPPTNVRRPARDARVHRAAQGDPCCHRQPGAL